MSRNLELDSVVSDGRGEAEVMGMHRPINCPAWQLLSFSIDAKAPAGKHVFWSNDLSLPMESLSIRRSTQASVIPSGLLWREQAAGACLLVIVIAEVLIFCFLDSSFGESHVVQADPQLAVYPTSCWPCLQDSVLSSCLLIFLCPLQVLA